MTEPKANVKDIAWRVLKRAWRTANSDNRHSCGQQRFTVVSIGWMSLFLSAFISNRTIYGYDAVKVAWIE